MSDQTIPSMLSDEELASAIDLVRAVFSQEELNQLQPLGPAAVYTSMITIWMMIVQRLGGGKTLTATVKDMLSGDRALLPSNKRLREGTLSESSGAYAGARKRLKLETVELFAERVCQSLIEDAPPLQDGRRAFILDGTTITLAPIPQLQEAFPPATNQYGESVWPVAQMLVAHELHSSCALLPEMGSKYGDHNTSEAKMTQAMAKRLPRRSMVLADSGFGIFSVAHAIVSEGHAPLLRLTKARFKSMRKQAELVEEREGRSTWKLRWTPSDRDRQSNPDLPDDAALDVFLHEVPLPDGEMLSLVTTLPIDSEEAAELYRRRYDVEHDIRDVKVTMKVERIRAKSVDMMKKELLLSIVAYNLVVQFRRQAAAVAKVPPRRLSFTDVWNTFESFLLNQPPCSSAEWKTRFERALKVASRDQLPNRPGRSHPRRAHPRRQKSTKFMKKQNSKSKEIKENSPPNPPK